MNTLKSIVLHINLLKRLGAMAYEHIEKYCFACVPVEMTWSYGI